MRSWRRARWAIARPCSTPIPAAPAAAVADLALTAAYDDEAALTRARRPVRGRDHRVREPAGRRRCSSSPAAPWWRRRPRRSRSPRTASSEKAFLVDAGLPVGPYAVVDAARRRPGDPLPGDPQDGPPGVRRQGPARRGRRVGDARRLAAARIGAVRARAGAGARHRGRARSSPAPRPAGSPPTRSSRTPTSTGSSTSRSCRPT